MRRIKRLVRYGNNGPALYVVVQEKEDKRKWFVGIYPCDICGDPVGDPVAWGVFSYRLAAASYAKRLYKDFKKYVDFRLS